MAEKKIGTLAVYLTANSQGVKRGFGEAKGYISNFAKWTAGLAGGITAGAFLKSTVEAWGAAEQGANRLRAVLASTSGAVGLSQKQLEDYASELQAATTYEDDAIIAMQTRLLTFGNLAGENFKRATALILDMAQATGQSADGITAMVGKALADPARYASAMGKAGVNLTKEQIAEIKKLVAAGKTYEAQLIILNEMQKKFGGAAAAAADSTTGRIMQMKNAWGDVQEQVGRFFATVLSIKSEAGGITSIFSEWAKYLNDSMANISLKVLTIAADLKWLFSQGWIAGKGFILMIWEGIKHTGSSIAQVWNMVVGIFLDAGSMTEKLFSAIWKAIKGEKIDFSSVIDFSQTKAAWNAPAEFQYSYSDAYNRMLDESAEADKKREADRLAALGVYWRVSREEQKKGEKPAAAVAAAPEMRTVSEARKLVSAELFGSVEAYRTIKKAGLGDLQYKQVQIAEKSLGKLGEIADNTGNAPELVEAM